MLKKDNNSPVECVYIFTLWLNDIEKKLIYGYIYQHGRSRESTRLVQQVRNCFIHIIYKYNILYFIIILFIYIYIYTSHYVGTRKNVYIEYNTFLPHDLWLFIRMFLGLTSPCPTPSVRTCRIILNMALLFLD